MDLETTRLMLATKSGDGAAFDELVRTLRGRACRVAQSLVGSREEALDLAQEAFLKVYRARDTFRDDEPFLPWFHRILRNTCFSHLRRHGRLVQVAHHADEDDDSGTWEIADVERAPAREAEESELACAFWAAFRTLAARDREILALRQFQGCSYREIARALAIPEGTVMSRLFHARRRLISRLGPELEGVALPGDEASRKDGPP